MGNLNKTRYTHRDYESIVKDLTDAIPSLTQEWTGREDSDPGIVLIKLISMLGDNLSYNIDKIALELFLQTVTQKKNCNKILGLLGYKMHWYRSASVGLQIRLNEEYDYEGNPNHLVLQPFQTTFKTAGGDITYTFVGNGPGTGDVDITSATQSTMVPLVEGQVVKVNFNKSNLINNRYYFSESNVDESHLWLSFGSSHNFNLVDNLYLITDDTAGSFEFNVDEYDRPYIEIVKYWEDIVGNSASTAQFTLYYFLTSGASGNVARNQLVQLQDSRGNLTSGYSTDIGAGSYRTTSSNNIVISHPGTSTDLNDLEDANQYTSTGYDPQTVEDAKKDASNFIFTHDTLVSASDYEKACRRVVGITASKLLDNVIIDREGLDPVEVASRCDDRFGTSVVEDKTLLKPYQVILYTIFQNAVTTSDGSSTSSNVYSIPSSPFHFNSYDDFNDKAPEPESPFFDLGFFPYKPITFITTQIVNLIDRAKSLNVQCDFGTSKIFPFRLMGDVYLNEPMSPQDTLLVLTNINAALTDFCYPGGSFVYGELPKFMELISVIQGSDVNIKYFDAGNNFIEWSKVCDLSKFDSTSFARYNGLHERFGINKQFTRFRIKNAGDEPAILKNLTIARNPDVSPDLPDESEEWIKLQARSYTVVQINNTKELSAFCIDLRLNTNLSYVR